MLKFLLAIFPYNLHITEAYIHICIVKYAYIHMHASACNEILLVFLSFLLSLYIKMGVLYLAFKNIFKWLNIMQLSIEQ